MKQIEIGTCIPGTMAEKWIPHMVDAGFECVAIKFFFFSFINLLDNFKCFITTHSDDSNSGIRHGCRNCCNCICFHIFSSKCN